MTKTNWIGWQNRANKTEQIWVYNDYSKREPLLRIFDRYEVIDKIMKIRFKGDTVDLTIRRKPRTGQDWDEYDENITLHRTDIVSVDFE